MIFYALFLCCKNSLCVVSLLGSFFLNIFYFYTYFLNTQNQTFRFWEYHTFKDNLKLNIIKIYAITICKMMLKTTRKFEIQRSGINILTVLY